MFAGSSPGARAAYTDAARELGAELARRAITVIYGGGSVGLMGALASAAMDSGGRVVGVIPQFLLDREVAKLDLSELVVVETMHARKLGMYQRAAAFIALPGGLGTLEELFEMLTWSQLGHHAKPCGLLNVVGYYDGLLEFLDTSVTERFVRLAHRDMLSVATKPTALLRDMQQARSNVAPVKWIDRGGTGPTTAK